MSPIHRAPTPAPRGLGGAGQDLAPLNEASTHRLRSRTPAPSSARSATAQPARSSTPGPRATRAPTAAMLHVQSTVRHVLSDEDVLHPDCSFGSATVTPNVPLPAPLPPSSPIWAPSHSDGEVWRGATVLPPPRSEPPLPSTPTVASLPAALLQARARARLEFRSSVWNRARESLRLNGILLPADNFWSNWPREQQDSLPANGSVVFTQRILPYNQLEPVYVKAVRRRSGEYIAITKFTSSELWRSRLRKLAFPPVLGFIHCPDIQDYAFVVMPPMLPLKLDDMTTVGDVFNFVRQLLEAVDFLHRTGISHGDIQTKNIMILPDAYAAGVAPAPFPSTVNKTYCLIDYSYSRNYVPDKKNPRVFGLDGPTDVPPEVVAHRASGGRLGYNPFPVDIWMMSRLIQLKLVNVKANLGTLQPLANGMRISDPEERFTSHRSLSEFYTIAARHTDADFLKSATRVSQPSSTAVRRH